MHLSSVIPAQAHDCPGFERSPYLTVVIAGLDPVILCVGSGV